MTAFDLPSARPARLPGGVIAVLAIVLLLLLPVSPAAGQDVGEPEGATAERIARIESSLIIPLQLEGRPVREYTLRERMTHWGVPGVSVAVIDGGEVAWAKAWGVKDVDTDDPVTPTTLFQAASISKPVAVMGMLGLVEAGRLYLARLAVEVQRSLRGESSAVLSPEMTGTMLEPVLGGYSLGFGTEPAIGRFGHGGSNAGFRATLAAFRDGRGLAIMTNSDEGAAVAQELMMAIAREYGWDEIAPRTLTVVDLTAEQRDAIAGTWVIRGTPVRITLTPTGDGLFRFESTIMRPTTYVPVSAERLLPLAPAPAIDVVWEDGRVVRLRAQGRDLVREP